ncbi:SRPBCC family protein [Occultella glacieicola]|uniref:SRPBCC family protein n=1 Tax=Occultella glacieicola TaxID=2518684 RepID=A0ABM6P7T0_9MICO|nr:SRPBCC family protein [Occultella glacieicola]TDE92752.1 SRPBCC family protein [Occultella glacieicola]
MTSTELRETAGRSELVIERRYPHPIERVWRAVTEPEHLRQWFPSAVELDLRPGGAMRFVDFAGSPAEHGRILECEAPHLLRFTWGDEAMSWHLTADADGTVLTLTHTFDDRPGAASYATGWEACLGALRAVVKGEEPEDVGPRPARHEELVHAFGLDRPTISRGSDGWTIRFERQLVCSAQTAWLLFLGGDPAGGPRPTPPAVGTHFHAPQAPEASLGLVTAMEPARLLALEVGPGEPGEALTLELTDGTGHGARLHLTVNGTDDAEVAAAVEQWGLGAVESIAREALVLAGDGTAAA